MHSDSLDYLLSSDELIKNNELQDNQILLDVTKVIVSSSIKWEWFTV